MSTGFKEGDRVQYRIDLEKGDASEGTIQKVLKGGESVSIEEGTTARESTPRYIIEDQEKHTYESFTGDHLIKKL